MNTLYKTQILKLKNKILEINKKLKNALPTIPSTLADELECNIFLKAKDLESFSKLRDLKDNLYAVIQSGGKQYKVKSGEILKIEKLPNSKSDTKIEFNDILAYGDNKVIEIGSPTIQGAKVEANLIKNSKNRTVLIFKKRRRQNSRRKNGHRQEYSMIRINKIFSKDGKILSEAEKISKPTKKDSEKKELSK